MSCILVKVFALHTKKKVYKTLLLAQTKYLTRTKYLFCVMLCSTRATRQETVSHGEKRPAVSQGCKTDRSTVKPSSSASVKVN